MARQHCCSNCWGQSARQRQAAAILAQVRRAAEQLLSGGACSGGAAASETEVPMKRYIHPIALPAAACTTAGSAQTQESLERVLECLAYQNQLLVDLLGAVNSLTAAMLNAKGSA